jgi:FHS family L-fucose permease-like MFS transporter
VVGLIGQPRGSASNPHAATLETGAAFYRRALVVLASLFFTWGFITVINNTLLPHLRAVFDLTYTQTTLIESVWFVAYFVASLPAAKLIERVGYRKAMVAGLAVMAAGALLMILAVRIPSYGVVLTALFVIASGITLLQVAATLTSPSSALRSPRQRG